MAKDFAAMESGRPVSGDSRTRDALRSRMAAPPTRVKLDEVQPNPQNPRYDDEDPEVIELADTLVRVGQLQPALVVSLDEYVTVFPDQQLKLGCEPWVVIVGNRRLAASRVAGRPHLDVRVVRDLVSAEDFEDRILIENLQRTDLPPLLEAEYLKRRLDRPGQSFRTVGAAIGRSHAYVQQRVELLKLIPELQQQLRDGALSIKVGRQLGGLAEEEQQRIALAGPPYTRSAPSLTPAVNSVAASVTEDAVSSSTAATSAVRDELDAGSAKSAVNPVATRPTVTLGTSPLDPEAIESSPSTVPNKLARTRTSVMESIDTALAMLDKALPDGGDNNLGRALADSRRHLDAARQALINVN